MASRALKMLRGCERGTTVEPAKPGSEQGSPRRGESPHERVGFADWRHSLCAAKRTGLFLPRGTQARGTGCSNLAYPSPPQFFHNKKDATPYKVASLVGPAGFEPTDGGVKVLCLTAWRRPIMKKDRAACITVRSLVGCLERFELSASRATIWRANQLRHRHHKCARRDSNPRPTA